MTIQTQQNPQSRFGFTLTEMLVAVGLLLVIMVIFAQIFQLAVTAMTNQKGLANNDQRARTAFTVLDTDLKRMSYRSIKGEGGIVPLVPGLEYQGKKAATEQQGYFYYSENDPDNEFDDVLQFTVDASLTNIPRYSGQQVQAYYGRALGLQNNGTLYKDQPDWDDGTYGDNVSKSRWAEVAYFLRHGTLYRRVMLVRDAEVKPNMSRFDDGNIQRLAQPGYPQGTEPNVEPFDMMRSYSGNFYTDFDFSAHRAVTPYDGNLTSPTGVSLAAFHGSLSNEIENNWPLGIPHFRFGFNRFSLPPLTSGLPREYVSDGTNRGFIGRYTHEETSNSNFGYPQVTGGDVFGRTDFNISTLQSTGRLNVFANGSRRGADILLNNVHGFNVEVWDANANAGLGGFINIGASNAGDFFNSQKLNTSYATTDGPNQVWSNIFDTWHSVYNINAAPSANPAGFNLTQIGNGQAPFVPKKNFDVDADPNNANEIVEAGHNWRGNWQQNTEYFVGDLVIPSTTFITPANQYDRINGAIVYRCVTAGWSGLNAGDEPTSNWTRDAGQSDQFDDGPNATEVSPGVPKTPARWEPYDNRKPIRAIRITVRFMDPTSNQMRQMSMIHSFNENEF